MALHGHDKNYRDDDCYYYSHPLTRIAWIDGRGDVRSLWWWGGDDGGGVHAAVVSAGIVTTPSPSSRKAKKPSSGGIDGLTTTTTTDSGTKRARDSVNTLLQQLTPTSERLAANAATKKLRAVGGDAALSFLEEEDSDDFSDDVVQPSKRRRASAATRRDPSGSSINKRPSPRRSRTTESPLAARSPSYNLSALPRLQTSFANARFMPTQATIPTLPDAHDEDRPSRTPRSIHGPPLCRKHDTLTARARYFPPPSPDQGGRGGGQARVR